MKFLSTKILHRENFFSIPIIRIIGKRPISDPRWSFSSGAGGMAEPTHSFPGMRIIWHPVAWLLLLRTIGRKVYIRLSQKPASVTASRRFAGYEEMQRNWEWIQERLLRAEGQPVDMWLPQRRRSKHLMNQVTTYPLAPNPRHFCSSTR